MAYGEAPVNRAPHGTMRRRLWEPPSVQAEFQTKMVDNADPTSARFLGTRLRLGENY